MSKMESLHDLYLEQLRDLYDAEQQLIKALPKMAKAASSEELKKAFEEHLGKTRTHAERLETVFTQKGEKAKGQKCKAMEGLVKEGAEAIGEDMSPEVKDAALIAAAQRVEHYEMAGYGCVRTYATLLGENEAASLLEKTLQEEREADETLTGIAEQINITAEDAAGSEVDQKAASRPKPASRRTRSAA